MKGKPTWIRLRCDVDCGNQRFWRGQEAQVRAILDGGRVSVILKGRAMVLERAQYEIIAREPK